MYLVPDFVFLKVPDCFLPRDVPNARIMLWLNSSGTGMN